jgi:hypothetical protein
MTGSAKRFAVIGAGAAGLCAAKHLASRGLGVTVYELGSRVGGLWVYESDNGLSPAYKSLHLNSEARVTAYTDFPFPASAPLYPDHVEVADYLDAYADKFDLKRHIRFQTEVVSAKPNGESNWRVTTADGAFEDFDGVIVATGHQHRPLHPQWRDAFEGEYLHAHGYRAPEPFRDKRVLVVGVGNSAVDIAADICVVTKATVMSARSPVLIMPRTLFGVPTSRVLARLEKGWMPWPVRRAIRRFLTFVAHGRMEQWGFVTPTTRTHPTTHPSLMAHMLWRRITVRPGIVAVKGKEFQFTDGSRESFDIVIAATGYEIELPFLSPEWRPLENGRLDLFARIVSPKAPGLYFLGMFNVNGGGNIRMMDEQAEWLMPILTGEVRLPSAAAMRGMIAREHALVAARFPAGARYALELEPPLYRKTLAAAKASMR